jgi:hypothetical protein
MGHVFLALILIGVTATRFIRRRGYGRRRGHGDVVTARWLRRRGHGDVVTATCSLLSASNGGISLAPERFQVKVYAASRHSMLSFRFDTT